MKYKLLILILFFSNLLKSQTPEIWNTLIGNAFLESRGYEVMGRICDEIGPRLMGSANFERAQMLLEAELKKDKMNASKEHFTTLGWVRGADEVVLLQPTYRKLKVTTLGYVHQKPQFNAHLVFVGSGTDEEISKANVKDKAILVSREGMFGRSGPSGPEIINSALKHEAKAVFLFNGESGFTAIAKSANFNTDTVFIPVFTITMEEGQWLKRLCEQGKTPELQITVNSYCKEIQTSNLVVTFPGKVKDKLVIGAHFDSWDLGQGAVDNGLGSAILYDLARQIRKFSPKNYYTIEFVWFTGEELGLIGSKKYVEMHAAEKIIAYLNFDMTGYPVGFNVMGFEYYRPFFENLVKNLNGFNLKDGVKSNPGTGSDHVHFMMAGIPTLFISGKLDEIMYKYYHEAADTWDKVSKKYLSEAVAVSSIVIYELANNKELEHRNLNEAEVIDLLKKNKLDEQLKKSGEWKFKE